MDRCQVVGALNVTPDSFFDGGKYFSADSAVARAGEMLQAGADIIEVGGESTGPGSKDVQLEEELHRTIGAVEAIRNVFPEASISVDTWKSQVAARAIETGVMMVNDVTAGRGDAEMFSVLAQSDVDVVLMYAKDNTPRTTIEALHYADVITDIRTFLQKRKDLAIQNGIAAERIILDPGLGHFVSSEPQYSMQIIANLDQFASLGSRLFLSPSRKSFLAGTEKLTTAERLPGTVAASAIAVLNGAQYIRTHDVLEVRRACEIASVIKASVARPQSM